MDWLGRKHPVTTHVQFPGNYCTCGALEEMSPEAGVDDRGPLSAEALILSPGFLFLGFVLFLINIFGSSFRFPKS